MSAKHGLIIANGTGIIDLDYPGEIKICLHNPIKNVFAGAYGGGCNIGKAFILEKGQLDKNGKPIAIAQISLVEHKTYLLGVETEDERVGGFGSTSD